MIYDNGIKTIFNTKGVLKEKLFINRLNIWIYASLSHLLSTLAFTFIIIANANGSDDIKAYHIIVPLWGIISYALIMNNTLSNIKYVLVTLPYFIWLNIYMYIFILMYRSKYPNIDATDEKSVERYLKIKRLTRKKLHTILNRKKR